MSTVQDHGLVRRPQPGTGNYQFVEPYLGPGPYGWTSATIRLPDAAEDECLNWYGLSVSHNTYVTFQVALTDGEEPDAPRLTQMRYRDMTLDNIAAGGGDLAKLRFLATKSIFNEVSRDAIQKCFEDADMDFASPGVVEVRPGEQSFAAFVKSDPFARGHVSMLRASAAVLANPAIRRILLVSDGRTGTGKLDFTNPKLHMICELERPTDKSQQVPGVEAVSNRVAKL